MRSRAILTALLGIAVGLGGGVVLERLWLSVGDARPAEEGRKILYWWDPMIPWYKSDKPGKSPMGMDMVPVYEGEEQTPVGDSGAVTVAPNVASNLGLRTALVERKTLAPTLETFGQVGFDDSRTTHLHVRTKGWVERLHTRVEGEVVEKGQLLFEMFSPDLTVAAADFVRETKGGYGLADIARRKLANLGVSERQIEEIARDRQIPDRIKVHASQTGAIVNLNIAEGMYVEPGLTLMSITDLGAMWVMAEVLESHSGLVHRGMGAEVRLLGQPGRVWKGIVDYVYPSLKPDTRAVRLRIRLANPDLALKPNMYASVRLAAEERRNVLAVPAEAVIRTGTSERVVLALGDGKYRPVTVKTGRTVGDVVEVRDGLKEGDRVVTSAQFLLDSESNLTAGLARMDSPAPSAPAAAPIKGVVKAISADRRSVTLQHDPIPALNWPAMTMDFRVAPEGAGEKLTVGQEVRFTATQAPDGAYIAEIVDAGGAP